MIHFFNVFGFKTFCSLSRKKISKLLTMKKAYLEFNCIIKTIPTDFRLFETNKEVFVYIHQQNKELRAFNTLFKKKLEKLKLFKNKNKVVFCYLKDETFLKDVESVIEKALNGNVLLKDYN